ncbi:MAG: gamma-glutamyltransferase [Verrucomicrobiae bacterium]|nr:gamma-glutamyltransferase [Verrucomicrobiae bacterium]
MWLIWAYFLASTVYLPGTNAPTVARNGMVVSANSIASEVGIETLKKGGTAIDAAVATAFALAVTHPTAGNIGGGGFLVYRPNEGDPIAYDFRETAPAAAHPDMWLVDGKYSYEKHHLSHCSVGVPGTVAGLYLAWQDHGKLPWKDLVEPAILLAEDGIVVTHHLAESLKGALPRMEKYFASTAKFTRQGVPFEAGDLWQQPQLAYTLRRIAALGPDGFYKGRTAELIVSEMEANDGLITMEDLANYQAKKRKPVFGDYRGYKIISMPPPSSGGITLIEMLNILEFYPIQGYGNGSANTLHIMTESMRRAYRDRAQYLGDVDFNPDMPVDRLLSKQHASQLRSNIRLDMAFKSDPSDISLAKESLETTHFSIVDQDRNAVALTYTLEYGYGSGIVVPGGGFLLNNEMGDFNAAPGLTDEHGQIGTTPNLAEPGKRMLSSMTPTIVEQEGELFMVTGTPGGRTIINTVLQTILNVIDHGMNAQSAVDAGRIHHQWLPDQLIYEKYGVSPDTLEKLSSLGHQLAEKENQGAAEVIVFKQEEDQLEGGLDRRSPDGGIGTW